MPTLDCRAWLIPMNHRTLFFVLREFEETYDADPESIIMRPDQHDKIRGDWTIDTVVPVGDDQLFINEVFSDEEGRTEHWRSIPLYLKT